MSEPIFVRIHISLLHVDPIVQRALDPHRAAVMAEKFNPSAVGALIVNQRDDGKYFIIDGQHRHAAAVIAKYDGKLNCIVHPGLPIAEEAALFLALNDSKLVQAIDKFRMRVLANEPDAVAINEIIEKYGWRTATSIANGSFAAVAAIEKVYNGAGVLSAGKYPVLVKYVMWTINNAWGRDAAGAHAAIVGGIGQLFARYGQRVDGKKLAAEMAQLRPVDLVAKAKQLKDAQGGTIPPAMAAVLVGIHNKGRRTNRLPDWRWTR